MTRPGVDLIAKERRRQQRAEGWTADHDDAHEDGELAAAAACYALRSRRRRYGDRRIPQKWPWDSVWWNPKGPIRDLVRAGALIAAEIDRRLRAGEKP